MFVTDLDVAEMVAPLLKHLPMLHIKPVCAFIDEVHAHTRIDYLIGTKNQRLRGPALPSFHESEQLQGGAQGGRACEARSLHQGAYFPDPVRC